MLRSQLGRRETYGIEIGERGVDKGEKVEVSPLLLGILNQCNKTFAINSIQHKRITKRPLPISKTFNLNFRTYRSRNVRRQKEHEKPCDDRHCPQNVFLLPLLNGVYHIAENRDDGERGGGFFLGGKR